MTKEINDFNIEEESKMEGHVSLTSDFDFVTYDGPFKNVFGIKRILAVIIKETIDLYQYCSIDEIVDLIESVAEDVNSDASADDRITSNESYVKGEGTVKYDILVKVGIPLYLVNKFGYRYIQIRLNLEMQRDSTPSYPLAFRGLYYGSRLISDQLTKITKDTDYGVLIPVYSIWITLVGKNTDAANKILSYQLNNTSDICVKNSNSFVDRMNSVTGLLNIYFICIDKSILESKSVEDGLDSVIEFVSLLFAGRLEDERLRNHDIKFQTIVDKHGEELKEMVGFYSEVEEIIAREKAEGEARGEILGAIKILFGFGYGEDEIISKISNEFNLTVEKADDYLNEYYERLKRSVSISN